jgi:hypothetical protein
LVTTAPAAITERSPTVTPSRITTCEPTQTSSPTVMPRDVIGCRNTSTSGSVNVWLNARIEVCAPIRTPAPSRISPRATAYALMVQSRPACSDPVR